MKRKATALGWLFLLTVSAGCSESALRHQDRYSGSTATGRIWIHIDGEWENPPKDPDYPTNYRSAPATLIRFAEDHEFSMVHCRIIENSKKMTISNGDGQAIYIGSWSGSGSLTIKFKLIYETVQKINGKYPGPEEDENAWMTMGGVRFHGELFVEATGLDAENYEAFIKPERERL